MAIARLEGLKKLNPRYEEAYHCLAENPYVQVALWFQMQDEGSAVSGLLRANGSHKPAFSAMAHYVREGDTLTEPCGTFTGPKITVLSPANRSHYSGPLHIHVDAESAGGVFRIHLEYDGKQIRNYDKPGGVAYYPDFLDGNIEWQHAKHIPYGWHTLTILAYDKERNVSQTTIEFYHSPPASRRRARPRKRH